MRKTTRIITSMNIIREQKPIPRPYDFKMIGKSSYLINTGKKSD